MEFKELHVIQNYNECLSMMKYEHLELNKILVPDIISVAKPRRRLLRWKDHNKMDLTEIN
jgi:hypothetical protein